jgi:hypothetical protein
MLVLSYCYEEQGVKKIERWLLLEEGKERRYFKKTIVCIPLLIGLGYL